jgi:hypothetical protein
MLFVCLCASLSPAPGATRPSSERSMQRAQAAEASEMDTSNPVTAWMSFLRITEDAQVGLHTGPAWRQGGLEYALRFGTYLLG